MIQVSETVFTIAYSSSVYWVFSFWNGTGYTTHLVGSHKRIFGNDGRVQVRVERQHQHNGSKFDEVQLSGIFRCGPHALVRGAHVFEALGGRFLVGRAHNALFAVA